MLAKLADLLGLTRLARCASFGSLWCEEHVEANCKISDNVPRRQCVTANKTMIPDQYSWQDIAPRLNRTTRMDNINQIMRYAIFLLTSAIAIDVCSAQNGSLGSGEPISAAATCSSVTWTEGVDYALGTVVRYPPNSNYYKVVNVATDGTDATIPTISTWYWAPTSPCTGTAWPNAVIGGYYPDWTPSPPRIRDVAPNYNLIYLFSALPVGGSPGATGAVSFTPPGDVAGAATNLVADIQYARKVQGRKIILTVGGAGNSMSFPNRTNSQNFVNSIVSISEQLGGIDGIDWDTYEGSQVPDTSEMIWISLELKSLFPGFIISSAPAPWSVPPNFPDLTFCKAMVEAGALDYAAPQYYDGPNLAEPSYVVGSVATWVAALGADHVVVGLGINDATNYMSPAQALTTWNQVLKATPHIRGAFDWEIFTDQAQGWPFAQTIAPLIK